jgi:hypothetical protein
VLFSIEVLVSMRITSLYLCVILSGNEPHIQYQNHVEKRLLCPSCHVHIGC